MPLTRIRRRQVSTEVEGIISKEEDVPPLSAEQSIVSKRHGVWIRCKDKLPPHSGRYVVAYKREAKSKLYLFICDYSAKEQKWIGMHLYPVEVVFWMRVKLPIE